MPSAPRRVACLAARHRSSFSELATALGCAKTNVTGLVDRLERRALLRREADAEDRRVTRVVLTEAGSAIGVRLREEFAGSIAEHLGDWPADDRRPFLGLAQSAVQTLSGHRTSGVLAVAGRRARRPAG
jgi:DNA-binding MarR family transcriptional regulator